jgi:hypothetical protein
LHSVVSKAGWKVESWDEMKAVAMVVWRAGKSEYMMVGSMAEMKVVRWVMPSAENLVAS